MSLSVHLGEPSCILGIFQVFKYCQFSIYLIWQHFMVQQMPPTWVGCEDLRDWTAQPGAPSVSFILYEIPSELCFVSCFQVLEFQVGHWRLGSLLGHLLQSWLGIKVNFSLSLINTQYLYGVGKCMLFEIIWAGCAPVHPYPPIHASLGCLSGLKRQPYFISSCGIRSKAKCGMLDHACTLYIWGCRYVIP